MSLQACHECGKDVSSEAAACPHCGAKVKAIKPVKEKKPTSKTTYALLGLLGIVTIGTFAMVPKSTPLTPAQLAAQQAAVSAQANADNDKKTAEYLRYTAAAAAVVAVKNSVRDPDSLKIESARVDDNATTVCVKFRSRNGFGGMNQDGIVYVEGKPYHTNAAWHKHCTAPMYEQHSDSDS